MMNGLGIPEEADVEALLVWPCWQVDGKVSIDRLHIVAVMIHGRGVSSDRATVSLFGSAPFTTETSDKEQMYLRRACRAFVRTNIPDPEVLLILRQHFVPTSRKI